MAPKITLTFIIYIASLLGGAHLAEAECLGGRCPGLTVCERLLGEYHAVELEYPTSWSFPKGTSVGELIQPNGDVYLFRVIGGKYIPGFTDGEWLRNEKSLSYSFNPKGVWEYYPQLMQNYMIISKQNIYRENLRYPWESPFPLYDRIVPYFDPGNVGTPVRLPVEIQYQRLTPATALQDISFYDEVKVPIDVENPVAILKIEAYRDIIRSFNNGPMTVDAVVSKALKSKFLESIP